MADEGDAAISGDDEAEPDDAQVGPLLLGVPAPRDRGSVVRRIDPGGEVRHVQHQPGHVDRERPDHGRDDAALDLFEVVLADGVHRVPEPPMVRRRNRQVHEAVASGLRPPLREGELRAGTGHPVEGRQAMQVPTEAAASARRAPTTSSTISATRSRRSISHTAATSPKERWRERSGSPGPASDSRAAISSAEPR
jgi:hypothetical protein